MNSRIHQLAAKLLSNEPFDYRIVDFDQIIESTDPQLWRLITIMTKARSMMKGSMKSKPYTLTPTILLLVHTPILHKQSLLHASPPFTNRCCGGGSSEVVKILNRFGAIASEDTHSRLVTHVSSTRERERD